MLGFFQNNIIKKIEPFRNWFPCVMQVHRTLVIHLWMLLLNLELIAINLDSHYFDISSDSLSSRDRGFESWARTPFTVIDAKYQWWKTSWGNLPVCEFTTTLLKVCRNPHLVLFHDLNPKRRPEPSCGTQKSWDELLYSTQVYLMKVIKNILHTYNKIHYVSKYTYHRNSHVKLLEIKSDGTSNYENY